MHIVLENGIICKKWVRILLFDNDRLGSIITRVGPVYTSDKK